jgi:hypothetical protein
MEYILSEKEYTELKEYPEIVRAEKNEIILSLCIKVCDNMPVLFWDNKEPKIWGCIITKQSGYCDECPVRKDCTYERKAYSK